MVLSKLLNRNLAVVALAIHQVKRLLECFQEFHKHLLCLPLAGQNVGVLISVEAALDLHHVKLSLRRDAIECILHNVHASIADLATDRLQELVNTECLVIIQVKCIEKRGQVFLTDTDFELLAAFGELVKVEAP